MTVGTVKSQGTRLYFAVSASEIHKVACATGIQGLGGPRDQVEITCLDSEEHEFAGGLPNPGQMTVPINVIPGSASHQALIALKETGGTISWMIVGPMQTGEPTALDSNDRLASPGATTIEFLAYLSDFNLDIGLNEIWRGTVTLQRTGAPQWTLPTVDQA